MAKEIKNALAIGTLLTSAKRTYRIEEVLGSGGFGITYRVSSEIMVDNVPVVTYFALKEHFVKKACERKDSRVCTTEANTADVEKSKANFMSEANRLNKISASHNNIVKVNESFESNDTAYYVMEYIDGPSLRMVIKQRGGNPLSWEEAMAIVTPVADAVCYLHENRLTHLDIKPDNIILDSKKANRPVLIDFGLSKHYDKKGEATSTIRVAGCSDGYSPIEQYVGISSFSPKADVYALAATLLFLLTGKDPAIATELNEGLIREALKDKAPDYAIDGIVKALKRQSEDRCESVKAFMESIQKPREEKKAENVEKAQPTEVLTVDLSKPRPERKSSKKLGLIIAGSVFIAGLIGICIWLFMSKPSLPDNFIELADGSRFYGQLDDDGKPNGEGKLVDSFGNEYEGIWYNGNIEKGKLKTPEYEYVGDLINFKPSGYGTAVYTWGMTYIGNWSEGVWHGLGKMISADQKDIQFGFFRNDSIPYQPFTIGELVYGIDVSKWQRKINWYNLYLPADASGLVTTEGGEYMQPVFYAIMKATDGTDKDEYYDLNYTRAKECGVVCGAYHFLTTKKTVDQQVNTFINTSHLTEGDLPPILDLEMPHDIMKSNRKEICDMALEWLEKIEDHYGVRPLIYTYYSFVRDYLTDPRFENYAYFIAYHRKELPYVKNWVFWQFSEQVRIPAITDNSVDTDIFNGNYSDFQKYVKRYGIRSQKNTESESNNKE